MIRRVEIICLLIFLFCSLLVSCNSNYNDKEELKISRADSSDDLSDFNSPGLKPSGNNSNLDEKKQAFFLKSNPELFPRSGEAFIISFFLEQFQEASFDKRMRLISNYDNENLPSAGWAVAIRRLKTSTRFDVYLKDKNGLGGWYSLSSIPELRPEQDNNTIRLAVSFVIEPSTFVSGFISTINENFEALEKKSKQIGGILVDPLDEIISNGDFQITSGSVFSNNFKGKVSEVSIFRLSNIPDIEEFKKASNQGPRSLLKTFSEFCILSLVPTNIDSHASSCEINP